MRERITFVHESGNLYDPDEQLDLRGETLHIKSLNATREDRWTFGLYELPQELWRALRQCHELHIRWASVHSYTAVAPFVSRISPGLHIFFTPLKDTSPYVYVSFHGDKVFGISVDGKLLQDYSTTLSPVSDRFAPSATFQYYEPLWSVGDLVTYVREKACPVDDAFCKVRAESLRSVSHLDIDYDTISQSIEISGFWHASPAREGWDEKLSTHGGSVKVEVGIFTTEKATQPEEISLGGFLMVLGEVNKLSPTLFSFPSRHHLQTSENARSFTASFMHPTGLHPTLRLTFSSATDPPRPNCALHAYLVLPSSIFADKYQLSSPNFLASRNLRSIRSLSGEGDLEAPEWAISQWGSALLIELAPPLSQWNATAEDSWYADISLHLRYQGPNKSGQKSINIPWPAVFWACPSTEGTKMKTNPFDRVNIGYDGLFGPRIMFHHFQPPAGEKPLIEELEVPVLDINTFKSLSIDLSTILVVMLGFTWVSLRLLSTARWDSNWTKPLGRKKID